MNHIFAVLLDILKMSGAADLELDVAMQWDNRYMKPYPFTFFSHTLQLCTNHFSSSEPNNVETGYHKTYLNNLIWLSYFRLMFFHFSNFTDFTVILMLGRLYILCYICENLCSEQFTVFLFLFLCFFPNISHIHRLRWFSKPGLWIVLLLVFVRRQTTFLVNETRNGLR